MAAGVNYNNVWAALGMPVDVIGARQRKGATEDFHIGGSDASGVVWAVGEDVTDVKVGDEVVLPCGMWDENAPEVKSGADPMFSPSFQNLGLRDELGLLRPVHQGAPPSATRVRST